MARLTDALAVALGELDVARGDRVAVQLQNMPQWLLALVGAWKAGAAVVPVSPMYTPRERAVLLEDSGARVLIVLEGLEGGAQVDARDHDLGARPARRGPPLPRWLRSSARRASSTCST